MQKLTVRIISIAVLCALAAQAAACGETGGEKETSADSEQTTAPETEKPYADNLGEYDFGGKDFTMLVRTSRADDLCPEEATGDVVNDAIYNRNAKIADRFNVNIKSVTLDDDGSLWNKTLEGDVMSDSGDYDLVMPDYWWGCETRGFFLNLNDYDVLDFSQPYWCAGWNDNAEIYGQLYCAVGSMSLDLIKNNIAMYFNKGMIDDLKLEDPYELVRSKKWTLDKLNEMAAAALSDLNGDGKFELGNDRIGYTFDLQAGRALLPSCGMKVATKTADDSYEYAFMTDKFVEMYAKVYKLVNEYDYSVYSNGNIETMQGEDVYSIFKSGYVLFLGSGIRGTDNLRDMTADYGIIPYPMYDENQDSYYTFNYGTPYMSMLLSTKDPEMTAVMLEALNAESYKNVVPAYLDTALKGKYSRDAETAEMLDLVNSTSFFDFTFVNETSTDHIVMWFFDQLSSGVENIASAYDSRKSGFENSLQKLLDTYKEAADAK